MSEGVPRWESSPAIRGFVERHGYEPEALCPDRRPCQHEDEWDHPCDRNEQGQYECERAISAVARRLAGREQELEAERDQARRWAERHAEEKIAAWNREAVLVEALKELVRLHDCNPALSTLGMREDAWKAAKAALAGVVDAES